MSSPSASCVAIVRFSAAGDVLLTSAAIDALAAAWPASRLVFVTHARFAPLLGGHPKLHAVVGLAAKGSLWALARQLRRDFAVDAVLDLHGSLRSRLLSLLLWPRRSSCWRKRPLAAWAAVRLFGRPYRPRTSMARRLHAAVERLCKQRLALRPHRSWLPPGSRGLHVLPARPKGLQRVGLSPGAGWATKRWPPERFAALARAQQAAGRQVVLFGSPAEQELTAAVARAAPGCLDLAGVLDWPATFAAVAELDAFVAGDTGPMHLARGLGIPTVALFTSTPASQFDLSGHVALQAATACSPCSFYGRAHCPRTDAACLEAIAPAAVCRALDQLLAPNGRAMASPRIATAPLP